MIKEIKMKLPELTPEQKLEQKWFMFHHEMLIPERSYMKREITKEEYMKAFVKTYVHIFGHKPWQ